MIVHFFEFSSFQGKTTGSGVILTEHVLWLSTEKYLKCLEIIGTSCDIFFGYFPLMCPTHQRKISKEDVRKYCHSHNKNLVSVTWKSRHVYKSVVGGAVASWLVCSSPDRAVRVRALAGDIVLCSWARHFTLTVPLSTQVYKWIPRT